MTLVKIPGTVFFLPDEAPQQTAEVIASAVAAGDVTTWPPAACKKSVVALPGIRQPRGVCPT